MARLRKLGMMFRLIGSFILVAILVAAVGTAGLVSLNTLDRNANAISTVNVPNITYLLRTNADVANAVRYTRAAVLSTTASQRKTWADKATIARNQVERDWLMYTSLLGLGEKDLALVAQADPLFQRWLSLDAQVGQLATQNTATAHAEGSRISVGPESLLATAITD